MRVAPAPSGAAVHHALLAAGAPTTQTLWLLGTWSLSLSSASPAGLCWAMALTLSAGEDAGRPLGGPRGDVGRPLGCGVVSGDADFENTSPESSA